MECSVHSDAPVLLICGSCNNTPVCSNCITGDHNGHRFVKPEVLAQNNRDLLTTRISDNKQVISELVSDLEKIKSGKEEQKSYSEGVDHHIEEQRLLLRGVIDDIAKDLKKLNKLELESNLAMLEEQDKNATDQLDRRKTFDTDVTKILNSQDNFRVIKAVNDFHLPTSERLELMFPNKIEFWKGEVDMHALQVMFGGVMNKPADAESGCDFVDTVVGKDSGENGQSVDGSHQNRGNTAADVTENVSDSLKIVSSFQSSSSQVSSIIPSMSGKSWLKCITERKICLVDGKGKEAKTLEFESSVCGITESNDPNILYACGIELKQIQKISVDKVQVKNIFSTAPLFPYGIAYTSTGKLLVIMNPNFMNSKRASSTITKYSTKGKVLAQCQNRAFGSLARIRTYKTEGTVVVTNNTSDRFCYLMLLNPDLTIHMSYFGEGNKLSGEYDLRPETRYKPFQISDVCIDLYGTILICELESRAIEMLSPSCDRLKTLLVNDTEIPRAISVNGYDIWVGFKSGMVRIYNKP